MRDELIALLKNHNVKDVTVDRDAEHHGEPATGIEVLFTDINGDEKIGEFSFLKANHMSVQHMASVIISVITNRKYANGNQS